MSSSLPSAPPVIARQRSVLALAAFLASCLAALLLWQEGRQHQLQVSQVLGHDVLRALQRDLVAMSVAQSLMAQRWLTRGGTPEAEFRADAMAHARALAGFRSLSYVDPDKVVRWVEPLAGNEVVEGLDNARSPGRSRLLDLARQHRTAWVSKPVPLIQGGVGLLIAVPIENSQGFDGWISGVLDLELWLAQLADQQLLAAMVRGHRYGLWVDGQRAAGQGHPADRLLASTRVDNGDLLLEFRSSELAGSRWPWWSLALVLLAGLAVSLTVRMLQRQNYHTRLALAEAEHARQQLAGQLAERRAVPAPYKASAGQALAPALQSGKFADVCARLTRVLAEAVAVQRAAIWLLSDDLQSFECVSLWDASTGVNETGLQLAVAELPTYFQVLQQDHRINAADALTDPRTRELAEAWLRPLGIAALLHVGIYHNGLLMGVICLEHRGQVRRWQPHEEAIVSLVASLVAQLLVRPGGGPDRPASPE